MLANFGFSIHIKSNNNIKDINNWSDGVHKYCTIHHQGVL